MIRQRARIRFRKEGDLRLIGHRDLVRAVERALRRAGVQLSMSEGFHPKARLNFPSALSVGVTGMDEVMEVDFSEVVEPDQLAELLAGVFPPGLVLKSVEVMPEGSPKAQASRLTYEVQLPPEKQEATAAAIEQLLGEQEHWFHCSRRKKDIDLRATLVDLKIVDDTLRIEQETTRTASAGPREVLDVLGLTQLGEDGYHLTRTRVELESPTSPTTSS